MVAMLFGQFALAAYACAAARPITPVRRQRASTVGMTPCATMASTSDAPQNACEVHCNDGVIAGQRIGRR
jgi:hypothetical protein